MPRSRRARCGARVNLGPTVMTSLMPTSPVPRWLTRTAYAGPGVACLVAVSGEPWCFSRMVKAASEWNLWVALPYTL